MDQQLNISPAPHISHATSTRMVMADVLIGLAPAVIAAAYYFRIYAAILIGTCVITCLATEWLCNLVRKKPNSLSDLSAAVTGVILALSLPPATPYWAAIIGSAFAMAIGKMVFGGLGYNTFNPAMVGRAFLTACFGLIMTTWTVPATIDSNMPQISAELTTTLTQATPLALSKQAIKSRKIEDKAKIVTAEKTNALFKDTLFGSTGGCLGETSAIALLIGGIYLLIRRTITWHIPLATMASSLVFATIAYMINPNFYILPTLHLTGGALLLCTFFIATDPVTAPLSTKGMWFYGIGVGTLTMLIRIVGEYPEGVMYAILLMNAVTPLLDRSCKVIPAGGKPHA